MLAAERRRIITQRIQATGQVVVSALSAEFAVSEETVRRDLEHLEREGIAVRIYGGAVLAGNDRIAPPYSIRKNTNVEPKVAIARLLVQIIHDGDTLMVDESSTAAYGIRAIRHADPLVRNVLIACVSSLVGVSFVCAAEYIWFYPRVMFAFFILLGVTLAAVKLAEESK